MLRITGAITFTASALLTVLLFARIQSFTLSGTSDGTINGSLYLVLKGQPQLLKFLVAEAPSSFKALVDAYTDGELILIFGAAPGFEEISKGATVDVTHRWVGFGRPEWAFGCTDVKSGGRTYPYVLSGSAFLWMLGSICAAPLVCWSIFALPALFFRTRRPRA
jgi:hypothetical protein